MGSEHFFWIKGRMADLFCCLHSSKEDKINFQYCFPKKENKKVRLTDGQVFFYLIWKYYRCKTTQRFYSLSLQNQFNIKLIPLNLYFSEQVFLKDVLLSVFFFVAKALYILTYQVSCIFLMYDLKGDGTILIN